MSVDGTDTARLGRALGRTRIVGVLGEREDPLPGGGEFLLLSEPRLESGNLQESNVSFGLAADAFARYGTASRVRPADW